MPEVAIAACGKLRLLMFGETAGCGVLLTVKAFVVVRFLAKLGIGSERPVFKKDEPDDEEAGYRSTQTRSRRSSY